MWNYMYDYYSFGPGMMGGYGGIWPWLGLMMFFMFIGVIVAYVYFALVLSTIARKLKHKDLAWLAWVPIAQFFLLPILNKKEWYWGFIFLVPIVNIVFAIIWTWGIFEKRKYPGWLSLICLAGFVPILSWLAFLANAVVWGLVAWKDQK